MLTLFILSGCAPMAQSSNSYRQISMDEAVKIMAEEHDYIILDVRTPQEFAEKHIPNAINIPNENIAVVGDQIFTDVIGANCSKMHSILVEPLAEKDLWMTRFKRPIEELVIKKYLKKIGG